MSGAMGTVRAFSSEAEAAGKTIELAPVAEQAILYREVAL